MLKRRYAHTLRLQPLSIHCKTWFRVIFPILKSKTDVSDNDTSIGIKYEKNRGEKNSYANQYECSKLLPCLIVVEGEEVTELDGFCCWGCCCWRIIGYEEVAGDDTSGDGEATEVEPTEPGSLKPCVPSSGGSKKLKLKSDPASKLTSAFNFSGGGALPKFVLSDWSSLNTSIFLPFIANNFSWHIREKHRPKGNQDADHARAPPKN